MALVVAAHGLTKKNPGNLKLVSADATADYWQCTLLAEQLTRVRMLFKTSIHLTANRQHANQTEYFTNATKFMLQCKHRLSFALCT